MQLNWKIGGEAGFGIMTSGLEFSKFATRSGYHIYDYTEYPSLIRGGHNTYEVHVSDQEVHAPKWEVDILVCLNKDTFELHKHRLHQKSIVIYDPELHEAEGVFTKIQAPFKKIKNEEKIHWKMINTVALGASVAALNGDIEVFEALLEEMFGKKGKDVVEQNQKLAAIGYSHVKENFETDYRLLNLKSKHKKTVMTGNDAFSIASVAADCRYFAAYPMTPSSTVLSNLAAVQYDAGILVRHPEDEIAVISSALGASFAGVRSAVGTSGGGFALMVESLSYAGVAEIPIVVFLSMRPGPATGMPTWTEQGDLLFAAFAGHGEFPKIVLAPGDNQEMIDLTLKAFDLADMYQLPVIVLSDKNLSENHKSDLAAEIQKKIRDYKPNRGKIVSETKQSPYLRYKDEPDGISEMLIPGKKGHFYQANSYEHLEDSHTTEEFGERTKQVDKRNQKLQTYLQKNFIPPIVSNYPDPKLYFVTWGGMKGVVVEAQRILKNKGIHTGMIHFNHLYPLDLELVKQAFGFAGDTRFVLVENNSTAQFGKLLRMQTGIEIEEKLLKYDGRSFWPEEIVEYVENGTKPNFSWGKYRSDYNFPKSS